MLTTTTTSVFSITINTHTHIETDVQHRISLTQPDTGQILAGISSESIEMLMINLKESQIGNE